MTQAEIILFVCGILFSVVLAVGIPLEIRAAKKSKLNQSENVAEEEAAAQDSEAKVLCVTVIDMACEVRTVGYQTYKQPKAVKTFLIKFADDKETIYDVPVSEGMYDAFEVGQKGTLTLVNGQIDSFVLDEE